MTNFGIIGFGHWGPNYLKTINKVDGAIVSRVTDLKFQDSFTKDGTTYSSNLDEMLNDPSIDAIVVATPAATHYEIAAKALQAGKHLLVEKPICTRLQDAHDLETQARDSDLILKVGHIFLCNLAVHKMRELIETGGVGKPLYGTARRTHLGLIRDDVNVCWDLAAHDISIFNHLFESEPITVSATGQKHQGSANEDMASINLTYPDDITAHILVSWEDANKERTITVMGTNARIVFDDLNQFEKVKVINKGLSRNLDREKLGQFHVNLRDGDIFSPNIPPHEPLLVMCDNFVDAIQRKAVCENDRGSAIVKVLQGIQKSIQDGGTPVQLHTVV